MGSLDGAILECSVFHAYGVQNRVKVQYVGIATSVDMLKT